MFLSKIWFVLVGLIAGVAATAAFVAPRTANRRIEQLEGQRLDRAQYAAEQMLKTDAHRWIDYVAKLGLDAILTESLDGASRGVGEPKMIHATVKNRLRALVPDLGAIGADSLVAVDAKGRTVARLGAGEDVFGDSQAGAEVVADALRGYLSDDVWGVDNKLQRVAAAPVLSRSRDRIVGVVYVGAETGKRLVELWKKNLDVEVAVILGGQVVGASVETAMLGSLPELIEQRRPEIAQAKRTRAIPFKVGSDRMLAVAAPFTGQASAQEAYYVLLSKQVPASNPLLLLTSTTADDLRWGTFPWPGLLAGVLVILVVGLWLFRIETERPLGRLRADVQKLARGELSKLRDDDYAGKFGGIARDVNAVMELLTHARPADPAKKDLNSILGAPTPAEGKSVDLSMSISHFGNKPAPSPFAAGMPSNPMTPAVPLSPFGSGSSARLPSVPLPNLPGPAAPASPALFESAGPAGARSGMVPVITGGKITGSGLRTLSGASVLGATPSARLVSPALTPAPSLAVPKPPAPKPPAPPPPPPFGAIAGAPATVPAPAPPSYDDDGSEDEATNVVSPPRSDGADPEESHVRDVYAEYLTTRQQCGEPLGSLTLDKFRAKLSANRAALISKYNCRTARFTVYVKDGKAAIKASPVR